VALRWLPARAIRGWAEVGCGSRRARQAKPGSCWPRPTAGSPQGLRRQICRRRGYWWRSSQDG